MPEMNVAPYGLRRGGSVRVIEPSHKGELADAVREKMEGIGYDWTKSGIAAFQQDHELPVSGAVDPITNGALNALWKARHHESEGDDSGMASGGTPSVKPSGFIHSDVPGRTDRLPTAVPKNAYIIPADVVSGIGQGNSSAGAKLIQQILEPHSTQPKHRAEGGRADGEKIPIIVAGGEYVVDPATVTSIGNGNPQTGHRILDKFVLNSRKQTIRTMQKLDPPKRD